MKFPKVRDGRKVRIADLCRLLPERLLSGHLNPTSHPRTGFKTNLLAVDVIRKNLGISVSVTP